MDRRSATAFLVLVLVQAGHSVEEFAFRLWEVLAPARYLAGTLSVDPALGFAIANAALVGFGLLCWLLPVRRGWAAAPMILWGWAALEMANGLAHFALAAAVGGYFPGLYTAPLLIGASAGLIQRLRSQSAGG
jgi:hypothetical protein